jgi:hypothetical protein
MSILQMQAYQAHMVAKGEAVGMLETHHSYTAIRQGLASLYEALRLRNRRSLDEANVWSMMNDGITDPTKLICECVNFIDAQGVKQMPFLDLHEVSAGVVLDWLEELEGSP